MTPGPGDRARGDASAERLLPPAPRSALAVGLVAAVLAFFAVLALAMGLAAGRLAAAWNSELAETATLQIFAPDDEVEQQARAALNVLRTTAGVRSVRMIELEEQRDLLAPWLGTELALETLPLPLLIDVRTDPAALNRASLDLRLAAEAPGAVFDDHGAWRAPLIGTAERLRVFAWVCLGLLALAFGAALGLAAQATLAGSAAAIGVLRQVGARDAFIAGALVRRAVTRTVAGAAAGTAAGMGLLAMVPRGSEAGFFLVSIGPQGWHWLPALIIPPAAGAIAWLVMGQGARRSLRRWR